MRKYSDFSTAVRKWAAPSILGYYLRRRVRPTEWLQLHYEDLVTRPQQTLRTVCGFVDVGFEAEMLAYRGKPYFGIGGNRMRDGRDERIVLDEKWKEELSWKYRLAFTISCGWLNKLYGY
jgi:hypothetical protein